MVPFERFGSCFRKKLLSAAPAFDRATLTGPSCCRQRRAEPRRFPFRSFSEPKPRRQTGDSCGRRFVRQRRHAGRGLVRPDVPGVAR